MVEAVTRRTDALIEAASDCLFRLEPVRRR